MLLGKCRIVEAGYFRKTAQIYCSFVALGLPGRGQREADVQRAAREGGDQGEGAAKGGGQENEKGGGRAQVCFSHRAGSWLSRDKVTRFLNESALTLFSVHVYRIFISSNVG